MAEQLSDDVQISFDVSEIVCRHYAEGFCRHGSHCFLPHLDNTKRKRDNVCRYFLNRTCSYGPKCTFDHVHFKTENGKTTLHLDRAQMMERTAIAATTRRMPTVQKVATYKIERSPEREFWETLKNLKSRNLQKDNRDKQISNNYVATNYDTMFPPLSCGSDNPEGTITPELLKTSQQWKTPKKMKIFVPPPTYPSPVEYPNFHYIQKNFPCNPIDLSPDTLFDIFKYRAEILQEKKLRNLERTDKGTQVPSETDSVTSEEVVPEIEDIASNIIEDEHSGCKKLETEKEAGISDGDSTETVARWYHFAWNYFKRKLEEEAVDTAEPKRLE